MSWDVIIFKLNKEISNAREINETTVETLGTEEIVLEKVRAQFPDAEFYKNSGMIKTENFTIEFRILSHAPEQNHLHLHLYGKEAIYPIVDLCKNNGWCIFDTTLGEILNLSQPENNGYDKFNTIINRLHKK